MRLKGWILPIILTAFLMPGIDAQVLENPCDSKSAQKQYLKAREMRRSDNWENTLDQYRKAMDKCPDWPLLYAEIAVYLQQYGRDEEAVEILKEAGQPLYDARPDWLFRLGLLEYDIQQFEASAQHLKAYLATDHKNDHFRRHAKETLAHAEFSIQALANPVEVEFDRLPSEINSAEPEYLPVLTANEQLMVFTRRIGGREEIYFSIKNDRGEWQVAEPMELGNANFRRGAFTISPDARLIVFAMADHPDCLGNFDLFYLKREGNKWTGPKNMGRMVNTPQWESQPSIGPDSRSLYFVSDRKGGEGGKDIWYTRMIAEDQWMEPANIGPVINTARNESTPYLHRDGESFYFRSEGHPGLGSYDIFLSRLSLDSGFTHPMNLGYPINGFGNEGGLFVKMDGEEALYATSSLEGEGEIKDIYKFKLPEKFKAKPSTYIQATVFDAETGMPVKASIALNDYERERVVFNAQTDAEGNFLSCVPVGSNYALQATAPGYLLQSERFELTGDYSVENPFEVVIAIRKAPVYVDSSSASEPVVLKNVLFEFGTATLLPGSFKELDVLASSLKSDQSSGIKIHGHTDNVGTPEANLDLSERRARAVYDHLVSKDIDPDRLSYRGFGETRPIASNETEEGRRLNRRVEFIYIPN